MSQTALQKSWREYLTRFKTDRDQCKASTLKAIEFCKTELAEKLASFSADNIEPVRQAIATAHGELNNSNYGKPVTIWEVDFDIDSTLSQVPASVFRKSWSGQEHAVCFDAGEIFIECVGERISLGKFEVEFRCPSSRRWSMQPSTAVYVKRYDHCGLIGNHGSTHPHVNSSSNLCCGNAHHVLNEAMHSGNLKEALETVKMILSGYNPSGAYWRVEEVCFPKCEDCGNRAPSNKMTEINGRSLCPNCVEVFEGTVYKKADLADCACCKIHLPKAKMKVHGKRHVCEKCYDTVALSRECANCGKLHDKSVSKSWVGYDICPECWVVECPMCDSKVERSGLMPKDNAWKCTHCHDKNAAQIEELKAANKVKAAAAAPAPVAASDAPPPSAEAVSAPVVQAEEAPPAPAPAPPPPAPVATATSRCSCGARVHPDLIRNCSRSGQTICDVCDPDETGRHRNHRD